MSLSESLPKLWISVVGLITVAAFVLAVINFIRVNELRDRVHEIHTELDVTATSSVAPSKIIASKDAWSLNLKDTLSVVKAYEDAYFTVSQIGASNVFYFNMHGVFFKLNSTPSTFMLELVNALNKIVDISTVSYDLRLLSRTFTELADTSDYFSSGGSVTLDNVAYYPYQLKEMSFHREVDVHSNGTDLVLTLPAVPEDIPSVDYMWIHLKVQIKLSPRLLGVTFSPTTTPTITATSTPSS